MGVNQCPIHTTSGIERFQHQRGQEEVQGLIEIRLYDRENISQGTLKHQCNRDSQIPSLRAFCKNSAI